MAEERDPGRWDEDRRDGGDEREPAPSAAAARPTRPAGPAGWSSKRRAKIRAEIERNRRGEYKVPTWVLAVILVAFVVGWALFIALS